MILWVLWEGLLAGWAIGLGLIPHQFSQFKAKYFHELKGFLNKMLLFIHNQLKICCWIWHTFFCFVLFFLNLWMCELTSQRTAVSELALLNRIRDPEPVAGGHDVGRVISSECYGVACSVWGGWTHHAPLPLHQHRLTPQRAQWDRIVRKFLIHLVRNTFPSFNQIHSTLNLLLLFGQNHVCECVREREKERQSVCGRERETERDVCSTNAL